MRILSWVGRTLSGGKNNVARFAPPPPTTFLAALGLSACLGCKGLDPPPPPPFQIFVHVDSDPGHPVTGATILRNNRILGTTGADGRAMLTLHGAEGETTDVDVRGPSPFTSPPKPMGIRLTRFDDKSKAPEYAVSCPPMLRHVVVAVKADNGPNLPVVYLNKVITRTDASGAAHFALEIAPNTQFQVTLDTSEYNRMKPVSPTKPFTVPSHDDILVFDQKFDVEKTRGFVAAKPTVAKPLN
jgi:hypothetical protein